MEGRIVCICVANEIFPCRSDRDDLGTSIRCFNNCILGFMGPLSPDMSQVPNKTLTYTVSLRSYEVLWNFVSMVEVKPLTEM